MTIEFSLKQKNKNKNKNKRPKTKNLIQPIDVECLFYNCHLWYHFTFKRDVYSIIFKHRYASIIDELCIFKEALWKERNL